MSVIIYQYINCSGDGGSGGGGGGGGDDGGICVNQNDLEIRLLMSCNILILVNVNIILFLNNIKV